MHLQSTPPNLPAGHRSGSHAHSVSPYLEEARRLADPIPDELPEQASAGAASHSRLRRMFDFLRGQSEVS